MTNVGEICRRDVVSVARDTSAVAAAQMMRQHHVGALVVCDRLNGNRRIPVGIVTDRDIVVEVVAPELRADTITVGDIMREELVTVRESEGLVGTLEVMRSKGVRRMPIVADDGWLVGIVSVDDLLGVLADELGDIAKILSREQAHEAATRR
jgi:CBS domain-containing protein